MLRSRRMFMHVSSTGPPCVGRDSCLDMCCLQCHERSAFPPCFSRYIQCELFGVPRFLFITHNEAVFAYKAKKPLNTAVRTGLNCLISLCLSVCCVLCV